MLKDREIALIDPARRHVIMHDYGKVRYAVFWLLAFRRDQEEITAPAGENSRTELPSMT
ncbi:MAG: hypothetical protein NVSMB52_18670 [Chloroflexota bacterium]